MKNVLSILTVAILFIATSCSKESKLNRKLDGTWTLTSYNNAAPSGVATFAFVKDKKTGTFTETDGNFTGTGTYTLTSDKTITTTVTYFGQPEISIYTVVDYSKTELTLLDQSAKTWVFTKN